MASAKATVDHDEIRRWVESRGGYPAHVTRTESGDDPGVLRIDYPGYSGAGTLERIDWDTFFEWFDRDKLAFLYQAGRSRFSKFVKRASVKRSASKKASSSKKAASSKKASSSKKSSKKAPSKKASSKKAATKKTATKKATSKKAASKKAAAKRPRVARTSVRAPKRGLKPAPHGGSKKAAKKASTKRSVPAKKRSSGSSNTTTDHDTIRRWVEARGGYPACVKGTGSGNDPGVLRIDYAGYSGQDTLERIDWDTFFEWFDRDKLAFLYQNKANSRFSKFVSR